MNNKLIQFAHEVGAPLIVTLDSHFVEKEHSETHDILMLIRDKKTKLDLIENKEEVWQFETRNLYYRTEQELRSLWDEGFQQKKEYTEDNEIKVRYDHCQYKSDIFTKEILDRAIENTRDIALRCEEMKLDSTLKLPKMYPNGEEILIQKAWENFKKKGLETKGVKYKERLEFELKVINDLGYADYFLTLEKIISETVKEFGEFSVNWGRGSGAGSLVSFCLGITDIDPLEYGLLFERFLDYSRRPVSVCSFKV
jgi:DNA polymerase-3 subunit alpha